MAGPLKNARHERFAQELAKGHPADAAYVTAGFKANAGNCIRLKGNERVAARVAELQSKAAKEVAITVADIAKQLDEDREFARKNLHSSAAVTATMGKAKILGLVIDKTQRELSEEQLKAVLDMIASTPGMADQLLAQLA